MAYIITLRGEFLSPGRDISQVMTSRICLESKTLKLFLYVLCHNSGQFVILVSFLAFLEPCDHLFWGVLQFSWLKTSKNSISRVFSRKILTMRRHFRTFWMPWRHVRWFVGIFSGNDIPKNFSIFSHFWCIYFCVFCGRAEIKQTRLISTIQNKILTLCVFLRQRTKPKYSPRRSCGLWCRGTSCHP